MIYTWKTTAYDYKEKIDFETANGALQRSSQACPVRTVLLTSTLLEKETYC